MSISCVNIRAQQQSQEFGEGDADAKRAITISGISCASGALSGPQTDG